MKLPLRILHLEDDPNDALLVRSTLEADGIACEMRCVESEETYVAALEEEQIDLILSDHTLPAFSGIRALEAARKRRPEVPVIIVSGTMGEESAIDSLKSGATDYVLKGRLSRLVPAVRRAMQEVEEREGRLECEAQLIEAQKMEVVGQLASGVAHDFSNILGVIIGYSDLMALELDAENPLRRYNDEIRHASDRASALTRQLLIFSSKEAVQAVVLDLNAVVDDMSRMLQRLIDEDIDLTILPGAGIGRIKADPGYIGQVLMNLVVNARDAMPSGGHLTLETADVTLGETECGAFGAVPGEYVMLSVRDTGTGITDEIRDRVFEAFFTTKPKGEGTGLGLATCQTIVRQCGGHIAVESELGEGTVFKVYFPRVRQALDQGASTPDRTPPARGKETVLVVEDEPSLRLLARGILEAQGYQVLSASNGQDALHVAREHHGEPIRIVVTDVVMPLMGGKVMADWLTTTYLDMKVLYTSGYTEGVITQHGIVDSGVNFLPKPYSPAALARKVREVLDR